METAPLEALAEEWRDEAETLRRRGAPQQANALESAAEDLEDGLFRWWREPLTAEEAAAESGYSADHLRRLARQGKVPTAGDGGRLRIERRHLPRKPGQGPGGGDRHTRPVASRSRVARTVLDSDQETEDGKR